MILDNKTKKYFKIICLVLFVVALTGCTANLDSSGKLIAKRAINLNTPFLYHTCCFPAAFKPGRHQHIFRRLHIQEF